MKKIAAEFKAFVTRGNVVDMSVGVIIGGAFTAIVNSVTNGILRPIVNALIALIMGDEGALESAVWMLKAGYAEDGVTVDLSKSIYIDWGTFITAIINFFIIALVLFFVVRTINRLRNVSPNYFGYSKEEYVAFRKQGYKRDQIKALAEERDAALAAKKAEEEAEAARKAAEQSSTDKLLTEILETLKQK